MAAGAAVLIPLKKRKTDKAKAATGTRTPTDGVGDLTPMNSEQMKCAVVAGVASKCGTRCKKKKKRSVL